MTDSKAVVVAAINNGSATAWVVSVSGNTATYGTGVEFGTIGTECTVARLSDTKFVAFYHQLGDCYAKIGTVSGTTIAFGAAYQVTVDLANTNDNLAVTALSESLIVFAWQETDSSPLNRYKYLRAATVSGTVITPGTPVTVGTTSYSYYSQFNSLDKVDSTTFIYRYEISGGTDSGELMMGTVAGTTITLEGPWAASTWDDSAQVRWLGSDRALIYSGDESTTHTMYAEVVSGFAGGFSWSGIDLVGTSLTVGQLSVPPDTAYAFGIRFKDVDVPQGATIVSAFIRFNNVVATNIGVMAQIYGEYSASPAVFTTVGDFIGRTLTPSFVSWEPAVDYANNDSVDTPDIKTLISQVISLPDWDSGDNLAIIIYDPILTTGKTIAVSSIDSAQPEPELLIIYGLGS
jgi:hypothetical protein